MEHEPISVVIRYEISQEQDKAFHQLMMEARQLMQQFPGFVGQHLSHQKQNDKTIYYVFVRFDELTTLKKWEESNERESIRIKLNQLIGYKPDFHYLTGLESWFSLGVNHAIIPPPRYKIVILTWIAVYCLLFLIYSLLGWFLNPLSMPIRILVVSLIVVLLITYLVMPLLTKIFKRWLYPEMKH